MDSAPLVKEHLHLVFLYCYEHDQGAFAVITNDEWINIITNETEDYYENIFKYVSSMCGSNRCKDSWDCCGELEYIPQDEVLLVHSIVKTNFDRENGGWEFKYFQDELYTSQGRIEKNELPSVVRKFLSHLDNPLTQKD